MEWVEKVDLQGPDDGGGRYQTKATSPAKWPSEHLEQNLVAHLREGIPELDGLEHLCVKLKPLGFSPAEGLRGPA